MKPKLKSYSKTIYDTLLQAYRPFLIRICILIVAGFVGRFLILSNAQVVGSFLDNSSEVTSENLLLLFNKLLILLIVSFVLTLLFRTFFSSLSAKAVSRIYDETTYRVSRFPISFFDNQPVGKITTRFASDYGNIFRLFGGPLAEFLSILFDLVSIVILMAIVHPYFILTLILTGAAYYYLLQLNQSKLRETRRLLSTQRAPSIAHFSETVQGSTIVRLNQKEESFIAKFSEYDSLYLNTKWNTFWLVTRFSIELTLLSTCLFAINGFICLVLIQQNVIGIGTTGAILSFTLLSTHTLQMFFEWFSQFEEAFSGVEKLDEYIRAPIEAGVKLPYSSDFSTNHEKHGVATGQSAATENQNTEITGTHLSVDHLYFKYPSSENYILENINFSLKHGEKLGIIGRTGSGKTTLISVLLRLYPIEKGVILLNSKNVPDTESHRALFSVISQDQLFLTGTVRDNLDLFNKFTNEELTAVLKKVGLKCSLQDIVLEKGQNLSYGEKQLLSLARGLLQNSEIFIFDEATSNVDPQSEALMNSALSELLSNKTQIRIAHRLQTVKDCNSILWLDQGKIKMYGPTKEVLEAFLNNS